MSNNQKFAFSKQQKYYLTPVADAMLQKLHSQKIFPNKIPAKIDLLNSV